MERIHFSDNASEILKQNTTDYLNESKGLSVLGINKEKENELSHLLGILRTKQKKLNDLRFPKSASSNAQVILNDLKKTYCLEPNTQECTAGSTVLFGLSDITVDDGTSEKLTSVDETRFLSQSVTKSFFEGHLPADNFLPTHLSMKIKTLRLMLILHKENCATVECFNLCRELSEKLSNMLLLKQKTIAKIFQVFQEAFDSLKIEAISLKYKVLRNYYSEDGVVKASQKLKEIIIEETEILKKKEADLTEKVAAFKKLEGTNYNNILSDYLLVCQSIHNKMWVLENMK